MADKLSCGTRNGFVCVAYNIFISFFGSISYLTIADKRKSKKMIKLFCKSKNMCTRLTVVLVM